MFQLLKIFPVTVLVGATGEAPPEPSTILKPSIAVAPESVILEKLLSSQFEITLAGFDKLS